MGENNISNSLSYWSLCENVAEQECEMVSGEALDASSAHTCSNGKILHFRAAVMWSEIVSQWPKIPGTMS